MGAHSKLAPSGSSRWMPCPGSIALCGKIPVGPKSTHYADEGTAAHELGALALKEGKDAVDYLGKVIQVEDKPFTVTEEMAEAVQVYLDGIMGILSNCGEGTVTGIEKRFDLGWLYKGMRGTTDYTILDKTNRKLYVIDYKHGAGTMVEVEWNSQLMIYALGALYDAWDIDAILPVTETIDMVDILIVQPRIDHEDGPVRSWSISSSDLMYWGLNVLRPAAMGTEAEGAMLTSGKHCKFCDAQAICPEKIEKAYALAKTEFSKPILPSPENLTPEDLVNILDKAKYFDKWLDSVQAYAFRLLEMGQQVPGYKLVNRKSNRKWVDDSVWVEAELEKALGEGAYTKKILSVAQAEKAIKKASLSPEAILDGLWEKPEAGVTMAPESDKRKAVAPPEAVQFLEGASFLG